MIDLPTPEGLDVPRRAVSEMNEVLGGWPVGERLTVVMRDERYGTFVVRGYPRSVSTGDMYLGGIQVAAPPSQTAGITVRKVAREVRTITSWPEVSGNPVHVADIQHGDLVLAEYEAAPYGEFEILGYATASTYDSTLLVGPWILNGPEGPNARLKALLGMGYVNDQLPRRNLQQMDSAVG